MGQPDRYILGAATAWWVSALLLFGSFPLGWVVTDRLEQDNAFCNACHLREGVPLHIDIRHGFDAERPGSLAAVHGRAEVDTREDAAFRCIDCHGGHDLPSRAKVKVLAAKDTFWWLVGHYDEPDHMAWPLEDGDCVQCHGAFAEGDRAEWETPRFHQLAVHNTELGVDCVECHLVHDPGGNPQGYFLHGEHVRSQCARCHAEYETP